jgi:hypothetical protein
MAKFGTYLLPEHSISSNRTTVETMAVRRRSQGSVLSGDDYRQRLSLEMLCHRD